MMSYLSFPFECLLCCINCFNLRDFTIQTFVFKPPEQPSYTLRKTQTLLELSKCGNRKFINNNDQSRKQSNELNRQKTYTQEQSRKQTKLTDGNSIYQPLIISYFSEECIQYIMIVLLIARLSEIIQDKDGIRYHITGIEKVQQLKSHQTLKEEQFIRQETLRNDKYFISEVPQRTADLEIYQLILISSERTILPYEIPQDINISGHIIGDKYVPLLYFELCETIKSDLLLIHSHGNSCDMGQIIDTYLDISYNTKVNVIGYDYPGYGQSLGEPNDYNSTEALETVFKFATNQLGFKHNNIILYGQSIGSGPTLKLAAKQKVGGVVLHSAFTSVLRVISPNIENHFDLFPNIENIQKVSSTVMIVHGSEDTQIPLTHAEELSKAAKKLHSFVVIRGAGHNDIEIEDWYRVKKF